jgi:Glyoxalase superfamily protein
MTSNEIERLKREAKKLRKQEGTTHSQALDKLAQQKGYKNWSLLMKAQPK